MRFKPAIAIGILCLLAEMGHSGAIAESPPGTNAAWSFHDGDRVALIGGTFIEREQRYGYLETVLTLSNPDKTITFRNLGWSGDTVGGVSRSGFDPPEAGFKQLIDQVNAVKPTVIIVGYGANESFTGKAGLDAFTKGLERLIDALKPTKARFILLAPLKQENLGPPLPEPTQHNQDIALYAGAIEGVAKRTGGSFAQLDALFKEDQSPGSPPLTDNGIHLTPYGYWKFATYAGLEHYEAQDGSGHKGASDGESINLSMVEARRVLSRGHYDVRLAGFQDLKKTPLGVRFTFLQSRLPLPATPSESRIAKKDLQIWDRVWNQVFQVEGLSAGDYRLQIDDITIARYSQEAWSRGVSIKRGPDVDQVEQLRKTIIRKNRLFFHRWRPQNITYLLGFRKHEQGNNAIEIPQFDPLVEEQEKKIGELKKPVPHVYELIREDAKGASK